MDTTVHTDIVHRVYCETHMEKVYHDHDFINEHWI